MDRFRVQAFLAQDHRRTVRRGANDAGQVVGTQGGLEGRKDAGLACPGEAAKGKKFLASPEAVNQPVDGVLLLRGQGDAAGDKTVTLLRGERRLLRSQGLAYERIDGLLVLRGRGDGVHRLDVLMEILLGHAANNPFLLGAEDGGPPLQEVVQEVRFPVAHVIGAGVDLFQVLEVVVTCQDRVCHTLVCSSLAAG